MIKKIRVTPKAVEGNTTSVEAATGNEPAKVVRRVTPAVVEETTPVVDEEEILEGEEEFDNDEEIVTETNVEENVNVEVKEEVKFVAKKEKPKAAVKGDALSKITKEQRIENQKKAIEAKKAKMANGTHTYTAVVARNAELKLSKIELTEVKKTKTGEVETAYSLQGIIDSYVDRAVAAALAKGEAPSRETVMVTKADREKIILLSTVSILELAKSSSVTLEGLDFNVTLKNTYRGTNNNAVAAQKAGRFLQTLTRISTID